MPNRTKKFYDSLRRKVMSKTYVLTELSEINSTDGVKAHRLTQSETQKGHTPLFFGEFDDVDIDAYDGTFKCPEVTIFEIQDARVIGRTEFVLKDSIAYFPNVIDPKRDMFTAEIEGRAKISTDFKKVSFWSKTKQLRIEKGISLLGQCNGNFAHFLIEAMPRLALIDEIPEFDGFPLLVDRPLHPRLLEILALLNRKNREVIHVSNWQQALVKNLIYLTPATYIPPEDRTRHSGSIQRVFDSHTMYFSTMALTNLRKVACQQAERLSNRSSTASRLPTIQWVSNSPNGESTAFVYEAAVPKISDMSCATLKRVYLRRQERTSGNGRSLINTLSVENILSDRGFVAVDPAELSIAQQIHLLKNCECVVSPVGAAVLNLLFRAPGASVVLLAPSYPGASFSYFSNLCAVLGHRVSFVLGRQIPNPDQPRLNRDFFADLSALEKALDRALNESETHEIMADK